jgi:hypothetical protein
MESSYPFNIRLNENALPEVDCCQLYQVSASFDAPKLFAYQVLLDKYSRTDWRISLVDTTALIMEERASELAESVEFDEEGYLLDMYLDSEKALNLFIKKICPVFQDLTLFESYLRRVADTAKA